MKKMSLLTSWKKVATSATLPVFVLVVAGAALPAMAAVEVSVDAETGYRVLTVAAGEYANYSEVLDASVPGIIKRGTLASSTSE